MYGQIHCIVKQLVLEEYGESIWRKVMEKSQANSDEYFMVFISYPDTVTTDLLDAVCEVTQASKETILKLLGTHFVAYCMRHGYDKMLKTLGSDIFVFIQNLDSLHYLLSVTYKGIVAPSFRCERDVDDDLLLHYYSKRKGYYPIVIEKFDNCTILFSDIVTFTNIASACSPMAVINMLNELYNRFDSFCNRHGVYKVETIGDSYMSMGGVPEVQDDHAERIADFAIDIVGSTPKVKSHATGLPVQIRVGIHSGPVVAGVVGKRMPRYCLFGDTVNTASRMESHGLPGRIHLSDVTYGHLYRLGYIFRNRGKMLVKGKGQMTTYFMVGSLRHQMCEPEDSFTVLPETACPDPVLKERHSILVKHGTRKSFNFLKMPMTDSSTLCGGDSEPHDGTNVDTGGNEGAGGEGCSEEGAGDKVLSNCITKPCALM